MKEENLRYVLLIGQLSKVELMERMKNSVLVKVASSLKNKRCVVKIILVCYKVVCSLGF